MSKKSYILWIGILVVLMLLMMPYVWNILKVVFFSKQISMWRQLQIYQWAAIGIILFSIFHHFVKKNMKWLETFSHELTHTVVALLFMRKIHGFHAENGHGVVYMSSTISYGKVPISLAPYCLPIFTYLLLSIRCLMNFHGMWLYDILIGITVAFHFFCFKNQMSRQQPDINQYPLSFSYLYIITALTMNFCIIWVAFFPQYNVYTSFWRLVKAIWGNLVSFVSFLL